MDVIVGGTVHEEKFVEEAAFANALSSHLYQRHLGVILISLSTEVVISEVEKGDRSSKGI